MTIIVVTELKEYYRFNQQTNDDDDLLKAIVNNRQTGFTGTDMC
jgi:hypothetical protein